MKKDTLRAAIVAAVIFVLYNIIAFVIPFVHTGAFWLSYIFTLVSFVVAAVSVYIAFARKDDAKSRFYGFPIARIGVVYGIAQVVVSVVVMALSALIPWWIPLVVYAVGLGAAVIGLIGAEAIVEEIETQDVKLKDNTAMMRALQSKISQLAAQSEDAAIQALAEEIRYSDPVSCEQIADAEADLVAVVDQLQAAYIDGEQEAMAQLCRKAMALLAERNRLCKLNQG